MAYGKQTLSNWPFVRGICRSPVDSLHKGPVMRALVFSLVSLNKLLNKQSRCRWFTTTRRSCDVALMLLLRCLHMCWHPSKPDHSHSTATKSIFVDILMIRMFKLPCWQCPETSFPAFSMRNDICTPVPGARWVQFDGTFEADKNGRHFADDIFKFLFFYEHCSIWRRTGDQPLSEPITI